MANMRYRFIDEEELKRKKRIRSILSWLIDIILVILLAYVIIMYGVERTTIVGDAMNETLYNGDKIIVNKMLYRFRDPKRFDIVVFRKTGKEHNYYSVRRIVGLPGETVWIKDGRIYINDEILDEPIPVELCANGGLAEEPYQLDANEYFVLGDNRNNSEDSRYANVGAVMKKEIVGKAWIRLHPFDFVHLIHKEYSQTSDDD